MLMNCEGLIVSGCDVKPCETLVSQFICLLSQYYITSPQSIFFTLPNVLSYRKKNYEFRFSSVFKYIIIILATLPKQKLFIESVVKKNIQI